MKTKQVWTLGLILAVLFAAVAVKQMQKPAELQTEEYAPLDLKFDLAKVQAFEITAPGGEPFRLFRENAAWKIKSLLNARADEVKVDAFLKAVREAKGEMRASGKEFFADFGIADEISWKVVMSDSAGAPVFSLLIGNKKSGQSVFVRKQDSEKVYITDAKLFDQIGVFEDPAKEKPSAEYWASTNMINFDSSSVVGMQILSKGAEVANVKKDGGKWEFERKDLPFEIDSSRVQQYLDSMKNWRAQKVVDPGAQDYGFNKSSWQLKLKLDSGKDIVLTCGAYDEKESVYYLRVAEEPVIFVLAKYYFQSFDQDDSHFFKENPFEIKPDALTEVVIRAGKDEYTFRPKEKKWPALVSYIDRLINFRAAHLLNSGGASRALAKPAYSVTIKQEGRPEARLEVGESVPDLEPRQYAARYSTAPQVAFSISEPDFREYFKNASSISQGATASAQ